MSHAKQSGDKAVQPRDPNSSSASSTRRARRGRDWHASLCALNFGAVTDNSQKALFASLKRKCLGNLALWNATSCRVTWRIFYEVCGGSSKKLGPLAHGSSLVASCFSVLELTLSLRNSSNFDIDGEEASELWEYGSLRVLDAGAARSSAPAAGTEEQCTVSGVKN